MEGQMTKARLLRLMREGRATFESLLSAADRERMTEPMPPNGWSVKDLLAHLSAWDRHLLAWLEADARGGSPYLPPPNMSEAEVDRFNARVYAAHRDQPLESVLSEFAASFRALVARAEALPEQDLLDPGRYAWTGGRPLWYYFAADTYRHYAEHLLQMRAAAGAPYPSLDDPRP